MTSLILTANSLEEYCNSTINHALITVGIQLPRKIVIAGQEIKGDFVLPCTITNFKSDIFKGTEIKSLTLTANSVEEYCNSTINQLLCDNGIYLPRKLVIAGEEITDLTIPSSVTKIEDKVFSYFSNLTSITIPNSVTDIEENAFYNCTSLTSIEIPNSVTSIGKYSSFYSQGLFSGCKKLEKITMSEELIEKSDCKMFSSNGKTIEVEVNTKNGKSLKSILVVRREYWKQTWNYEKEYLLPLDEESAMHYDILVASGEYEGFKISEKLRLKAMLYRLQAEENTVNDEMKEIFVCHITEHINDLIKLSEKEVDTSYLRTAISAGCITEENKESVLQKLKKSKVEEIKAMADLIV
jgi:hypothetical protein